MLRILLLSTIFLLSISGSNYSYSNTTIATEFGSKFSKITQVNTKINDNSVFVSTLIISDIDISEITKISYEIEPKTYAIAEPINVTYSAESIKRKKYYDAELKILSLPVFGLYSNYNNSVEIEFTFQDDSEYSFYETITTEQYVDPNSAYDHITKIILPDEQNTPNFSYFYLKSSYNNTPVILDIDGEVRWIVPFHTSSRSSLFVKNMFVIADKSNIYSVSLDGSFQTAQLTGGNLQNVYFHRNLDPGKFGILAELNGTINSVKKENDYLVDMTTTGKVIKEWDISEIFSSYMLNFGDDPSNFVIKGSDWFHINAAHYDKSDDSILLSSRENFVAKIDYKTGTLKWLLGDETKHWYVDYPSLQALSLTLGNGDKPIGQHALSIANNGDLLLFNDGLGSRNHDPRGNLLPFSKAVKFSIDELTQSTAISWEYDAGIFSDICSSVYQAPAGDYLVTYAVAKARTLAIIQIINENQDKLFEIQMPTIECSTAWNGVPIDMTDFVYD